MPFACHGVLVAVSQHGGGDWGSGLKPRKGRTSGQYCLSLPDLHPPSQGTCSSEIAGAGPSRSSQAVKASPWAREEMFPSLKGNLQDSPALAGCRLHSSGATAWAGGGCRSEWAVWSPRSRSFSLLSCSRLKDRHCDSTQADSEVSPADCSDFSLKTTERWFFPSNCVQDETTMT